MEQVISNILERARVDIQAAMQSNGINASGRTSDALEVIKYDKGVKLVVAGGKGAAPLFTTERGRDAGKVPSNFIEIIEQWATDKGINVADIRKFAGAIAYGKIKRFGYGRPSPSTFGSKAAVIYTPVVQRVKSELKNSINAKIKELIKTN